MDTLMVLGGLQKLTVSDFPGHLAAILFTRGCNYRCPFCHNPELVDPRRYVDQISEADVFSFLGKRGEKLDGVVITGGEPTVHRDLPILLRRIKDMGLATKLDTNGSCPDMIEQIFELELVDYIALDIKSSPSSYSRAAGMPVDVDSIRQSIELICSSGLPHELRMTYVEPLVPFEELAGVAELARGCRLFLVQPFQPTKALDSQFLLLPRPPVEKLEQVRAALESLGVPAAVR